MSGESRYERARKALDRFYHDEHGYHGKVDPEAVKTDYNTIYDAIAFGEKAEKSVKILDDMIAEDMIAEHSCAPRRHGASRKLPWRSWFRRVLPLAWRITDERKD